MPLVSGTIPNMLNGVSQQPMILRLPTQGDIALNSYASVVEGLQKRPPSKHITRLQAGTPTNVFMHLINRDETERYVVAIIDGDIKVWDLAGNQKTVNYVGDAQDYLTGYSRFKACTLVDYTFITNLDIDTAMAVDSNATSEAAVNEVLVSVDLGAPSTTYQLTIKDNNGTHVVSETTNETPGGDGESPEFIATQLATDLAALVTVSATEYTITRVGPVIYIKRGSAGTFTASVTDSYGNQGMSLTAGTVQRFTDLPTRAKHDMIVKVAGDNTDEDDVWFKFVGSDSTVTITSGYWQETVAPSTPLSFDHTTMPHVLVREANGTFTFRHVSEWVQREVGDTVTNPTPSFIGSPINYIFFFQNRLGFLSGDSVVFSEAGDYFNFFRTSVSTLVDSDRIDITAAEERVATLYAAKALDEKLLVFAGQQTFTVEGGEVFSPGTVSIRSTLFYTSDVDCEPELAGRSVFFAYRNGDFGGVRQYFHQPDLDRPDAPEITEHVNKYITGNITRLTAATHEDVLIALATGDVAGMWVYKYYTQGANQLQASWSKWEFAYPCTIRDAQFLEDTLYVIVQHPNAGLYLESITVAASQYDRNMDVLLYLDRRWEIPMTAAYRSYDEYDDITTITLPYPMPTYAGDEDCQSLVIVVPECDDAQQAATPTTTTTTTTTGTPTGGDGTTPMLEIVGWDPDPTGPLVGFFSADVGSGCQDCTSDVTGLDYFDGKFRYRAAGKWNATIDGSPLAQFTVGIQAGASYHRVDSTLPYTDGQYYTLLFVVDCGGTNVQIAYRRQKVDGELGVYTYAPEQTSAAIKACQFLFPVSFTIREYTE